MMEIDLIRVRRFVQQITSVIEELMETILIQLWR